MRVVAPLLILLFFRPLSSCLHQVDHAFYGKNPVGYHATNLILWGGLLLLLTGPEHGIYLPVIRWARIPAPAVGESVGLVTH